MSDEPKTLAEIEAMLVQEGEEGPKFCIHRHEQRLTQLRVETGQALTKRKTDDVIYGCPRFGHRGCAHKDRFGTTMYEAEIMALVGAGHLTEEQYWELRYDNNVAAGAVQSLDRDVREFTKETGGDSKLFAEREPEWKRRQIENWDTIINPLRMRLLSVIRGEKVSDAERAKAIEAATPMEYEYDEYPNEDDASVAGSLSGIRPGGTTWDNAPSIRSAVRPQWHSPSPSA